MTRIGSLCTGYGGLDFAVREAIGGDLAFVADNDPGAATLLAHRYPGTPNMGDIKTIDWASLGTVNILCGGYPCQPFSTAGRRLGVADERHIWPYILTAIEQLRPAMVVLENVRDHLTLGFDVVLADLSAAGYDAEWVVVTATAAGACHRRARLFIIASPAARRAIAGEPVAVIEDGAWIEPRESLFGMVPFTGRIPASGRMAGGLIYAAEAGPTTAGAGMMLPTPMTINSTSQRAQTGRLTAGPSRGGASYGLEDVLLKTPTAQLAVNGGSQHPDKRRAGGHGPTLADQVEHELLPTPTARLGDDTSRGADPARYKGPQSLNGRRSNLDDCIAAVTEQSPWLFKTPADELLPTPTAADGDRASLNYERGNPTLLGALLPTPQAADSRRGSEQEMGGQRPSGQKRSDALGTAAMLLPTPTAMDSEGARNATARRNNPKPTTQTAGWTLSDVLWTGDLPPGVDTGRLLPTPAAGNFNDGEDLASWEARRQWNLAKGVNGNGQGTPLPIAAQQLAGGVDWGPYEAAIRRWETVTGRQAPSPTVPGRTGERLNPALPEWMMGLPEGWITGVPGLSRNAMLKLAGNGVVPQQAELALRLLLDRAGFATEAGAAA